MQNDSSSVKSNEPNCIYLDYNGTTPIYKYVLEAMMPYFTDHFGNPSSSHVYGKIPKEAVAKARTSILSLLHDKRQQSNHESIIFTGCGSEADNLAIHFALQSNIHIKTPHIITSNVEHPAITEYLKSLEERGEITVSWVPVNHQGIVSAKDMIDAIKKKRNETVLVTLMLANNESGSLQPVNEVSKYCQTQNILFHTDAAQAVGKVSISLAENGIGDTVDMLTIVGHKFGAPKGIACLYIKPNCFTNKNLKEPNPMIFGGGQEHGKRAGTENVPYIVGMGAAADILMERREHEFQWQQNAHWMKARRFQMRKIFMDALGEDIVRDNGPDKHFERLPNTLSVGFKSVDSAKLLQNIQMKLACSAGSACHASGGELSPVLKAMNVPLEYARGTLRLSVGPSTTKEEIDEATNIIISEVKAQLGME